MSLIYKDEFYQIKEACIEVREELGNGFLEKVYEAALQIELIEQGFTVTTQQNIEIEYKGVIVGDYYADIVLDDKIILELKTVKDLADLHKAQLLNYLKATGYKLGVLINFPNDDKGFEIERVPNFIED